MLIWRKVNTKSDIVPRNNISEYSVRVSQGEDYGWMASIVISWQLLKVYDLSERKPKCGCSTRPLCQLNSFYMCHFKNNEPWSTYLGEWYLYLMCIVSTVLHVHIYYVTLCNELRKSKELKQETVTYSEISHPQQRNSGESGNSSTNRFQHSEFPSGL